MAQDSPSRRQDQFVLRMPDGMRDRISDAAKSNGRSMNAEIIQVLEMHYPPAPPAEEMAEMISGILRITNGDPPKERWGDLYTWLSEFQARLVREKLVERYGDAAGAEFDQNRLKD